MKRLVKRLVKNPRYMTEPVRLERRAVAEYTRSLKQFIVTSRFNDRTLCENQTFRRRHPDIGCIYCAPTMISSAVPLDSHIFVLEMNNDTNHIVGVGMVKNHPRINAFAVYENGNYNRYQYIGKLRIDRTEMTPEEETIMTAFDILCFTGNKHQKRGHGLKLFPLNMLYRCLKICDLVGFVRQMFVARFGPNAREQCPSEKIENNKSYTKLLT